jgi:hypothetical protein
MFIPTNELGHVLVLNPPKRMVLVLVIERATSSTITANAEYEYEKPKKIAD